MGKEIVTSGYKVRLG